MKFKKLILPLGIVCIGFLSFKAVDDYFEVSKNLDIFASVYKEVNTAYVDEVKPGELIRSAIDGMLRSLDPYTVYYSEAQAEDYRFQLTGTYAGIGSTIRKIGDYVVIDNPYEGFPAQKAGLLPGDKIIEVDGTSMKGKSSSELTTYLKGKAGTLAVLIIERPDGKQETISLERELIKRKNVPYAELIAGNTGYIKLTGFTPGAAREVMESVMALKNQGAKSLILDLRGNGGGLLHEAINIVNVFVPRGTSVVVTKGKFKEEDIDYVTRNNPIDTEIPLVVFIDGRSASASEIVSGALQDLDRAVLIGRNSYGKGLVQGTKSLSYNTQMKITIAKYYLPSGRLIQRLDYGHKVDGRAVALADSLKETFYTNNKRPVVDGEGIQPDIAVEMAPYTRIAQSLLRNNHAFLFSSLYRNEHESIPDAKSFDISPELYASFVDYLSDKDYEYTTDTEKQLKTLKEKADKDSMPESVHTLITELKASVSEHKENDLDNKQAELKELLEYEIVKCYYFDKGKIEVGFDDDPDLAEALELFSTPGKMDGILGN